MNPLIKHLSASFSVLAFAAAMGCSAAGQSRAERPAPDPNASTVIAEIALERGDCRAASETYALAAQRGGEDVARRAAEVALGCEHLPAALQAAKHWRELAPQDRDAAAVYATVALKLYRVDDARPAIVTVLRAEDEEPADKNAGKTEDGVAPQGGGAADQSASRGADAKLGELAGLLLQEADPSAVLAALSGAVDTGSASPGALALLGGVALEAYDARRAEQFANLALKRNPESFDAKHILARALVMQGDASKAVASAREAARVDPQRGAFEVADVLADLDRLEEARRELERLHGIDEFRDDADRRLALLALQGGDLAEAQRRFTELATGENASEASLLYLADIAQRDGDTDTALAGYRRLVNSSFAVTARTRAAALLLDKNERGEALTLLDDYVSEHPEQSFEITITKAHLLSEHGEGDAGIALLESALNQHPQHPALEYDRAALLERAGKVRESIAVFEQLLEERQEDPTVLNALGYTMADHDMDLPRAESLIRRSIGIMPDSPAVLDSLGWVRFKRGDAKGALEHLERAYTLSRDPEIAAHWGEALWRSGKQQEARKVWATALARNPDSEQLKATLTRLIPAGKP